MTDHYAAIAKDFERIQHRIEKLRDGDTQARAIEDLERRFDALLDGYDKLRRELDQAPERILAILVPEIKKLLAKGREAA